MLMLEGSGAGLQEPLPPTVLTSELQDGTLCPHASRTPMFAALRMLLESERRP